MSEWPTDDRGRPIWRERPAEPREEEPDLSCEDALRAIREIVTDSAIPALRALDQIDELAADALEGGELPINPTDPR